MIYCLLIFLSCFGWLKASSVPSCKWELSIAAVFQNDARFLKEWIEFHRLVGVEHFWLYNNLSSDHFRQILSPYISRGIVELIDWPEKGKDLVTWNSLQCRAFVDAISRAKGKSYWVAFIDTDEFLFATKKASVADFLKDYKDCAGVSVNWRGFGTSGITKIPDRTLMIELLYHCNTLENPWNRHTKAIVNPYFVKGCSNPHFFTFIQGLTQVSAKKVPFTGPFSPTIDLSALRIHHYWTRDETYLYNNKIPRYETWGSDIETVLQTANSLNVETDFTIFRFIPELKKRVYP